MNLLAIGASAGGPSAVAAVLRTLPKQFPAAVVVIQHIDEQMANGMAPSNASKAIPWEPRPSA